VIVVIPAATPVTKPVLETVATEVLDDIHGLTAAAVGDPVNCVVKPAHTLSVPVMVVDGFTVIVKVEGLPVQVASGVPPIFNGITVMDAITSVEPALIAVNEGILPDPLAASPMEVVLLVQLKFVAFVPENVMNVVLAPLQTV
jgi:hypothetical protein